MCDFSVSHSVYPYISTLGFECIHTKEGSIHARGEHIHAHGVIQDDDEWTAVDAMSRVQRPVGTVNFQGKEVQTGMQM